MAKLVLGTDINNTGTAAFVRDKSPERYLEYIVDNNGKLIHDPTVGFSINFNGVSDLGEYIFSYAFNNNPNVTGALDLSNFTDLTGDYCFFHTFDSCTNITSVDLSNLINIISVSAGSTCSNMFLRCSSLTSINLSALTTINSNQGCAYMFAYCPITNVDLSSLTTITQYGACNGMFSGCTSLTSVDLSSLATVSGNNGCGNMFSGCTSLTTLSFPALKTVYSSYVFGNMLSGVTGCTVHFPSNLSSYNFNCGGTNTTVLYDLPATE